MMQYEKPRYRLMGDRSVLVELGDEISPRVNQNVRELFVGLDKRMIDGIQDIVPGYRSLLVVFNPLEIELERLKVKIDETAGRLDPSSLTPPKIIEIPVVYGDTYGPDLEWVADFHKISPEEVIQLHTQPLYRVYMIGFMPGYPYLGEVPDALVTPRRETPRTRVPKGSVAIAQKQTGIYPVASPGGWQIIGRTPVGLFDPGKKQPSLMVMGDQVQFYAISKEEMQKWQP
jgi:KipI family sensor histidine kinase inhibitor